MESFVPSEEKVTLWENLKQSDDSFVELELGDGNKIRYTHKNKDKGRPIYVFNANFVASHVFDGTKSNAKGFSNVGEIKNDEIVKLEENIRKLRDENNDLESKKKGLDDEFERIKKPTGKEFHEKLPGKRLSFELIEEYKVPEESLEDLGKEKEKLLKNYELANNQKLGKFLDEIGNINFKSLQIDVEKINKLLQKDIKQLSKGILQERINRIRELLADDKEFYAEEWFRHGKNMLDKMSSNNPVRCPLCNSDISEKLESITRSFDEYFDSEYENFINELNTQSDVKSSSILIRGNRANFEKLKGVCEKCGNILSGITFKKIDFDKLEACVSEIETNIESKIKNVQHIPEMSLTNEFLSNFEEEIRVLNGVKSEIERQLSKTESDKDKLAGRVKSVYEKLVVREFDGDDSSLEKYRSISETIKKNEKAIKDYEEQRKEKIRNIKAESKGVSEYLEKMGVAHFSVNIDPDSEDNNITVSRGGLNQGKKLCNLSEGEKTALALAYFLSKFKNEADKEKAVVVIDDPVSSLDENNLMNIADVLYQSFEKNQLIVLSHNLLFLKFFNKCCNRPKCFLLKGNKLGDLPDDLKNFESPYFYMLNEIRSYCNGKLDDNCPRYLPNYIRRVLETFLSFQFAEIAGKSGSPGLGDFCGKDSEEKIYQRLNCDEEKKAKIKEKIKKIKRFTDAHSHGSIQITSCSCHLNEIELKEMAQSAIDLMDDLRPIKVNPRNNEQEVADACPAEFKHE